ncbi:hypothetical protein IID04_02135, partial [PVC group bacterium]|nr:hypothetical protein [PVC group bacterium]
MANSKLNFKGYQKNEAKVTKSFLAGNVDKGFKLLWSLLEEKPQLNFMTVGVIISCFVGDERDDYFDILKSGLLKFNPPDKILSYLEFHYYLLTQNLPRIEDEVKKMEKLKFPLDVIARNLHNGVQFKLAIKISRKYERKHPKNIENLEILLRCYTELHDWIRMKKIADKILLIDQLNVSAICKLARSAIVKENYADALKHLDNAEQLDPNNGEIHLIRAVSYHFLERFKDVNLPIRRAIDSMTHSSVDSQTIASAYAVLLYSQAEQDQINAAIETWDEFRFTLKENRLLYDGLMKIPLNIGTLGSVMELCKHRLIIEFQGATEDIEELNEILEIMIKQSKKLNLESYLNELKKYPYKAPQETDKIWNEQYTWDTITNIELVIYEGLEPKIPQNHLVIQFGDNHTSDPVKLIPVHFSFFWFLIEQHNSGENWLAKIDEPEICKKIDQIWKTVYGVTYTDHVLQYLDYNSRESHLSSG